MNINPFNKQGVVGNPISREDLLSLSSNPHVETLMNFVEKSLQLSKMIVAPEFFHPSFTQKERDMIVSLIYTIYPTVTNIEPIEPDGVIITCDDYLDVEKTSKQMDSYFNQQEKKRGSNYTPPKKRRKK